MYSSLFQKDLKMKTNIYVAVPDFEENIPSLADREKTSRKNFEKNVKIAFLVSMVQNKRSKILVHTLK